MHEHINTNDNIKQTIKKIKSKLDKYYDIEKHDIKQVLQNMKFIMIWRSFYINGVLQQMK